MQTPAYQKSTVAIKRTAVIPLNTIQQAFAAVNIINQYLNPLVQFFDMLSELSEAQDVDFYFTISCDKEDLPVEVFDYCEEL